MTSHQGAAQVIGTGPRLTGPVPAHLTLAGGAHPADRAVPGIHGAEGAHGAEGVPGTRRILIVDDEPNIRSFIGRALSAAGYLTGFAGSGSEGLRHALDEHYDLVILDLVMPDMDGACVLDRVLSVHPDQAVIVVSCVGDVVTKLTCLERGAGDYLTKPFSLAELLARVRVQLRDDAPLLSYPASYGEDVLQLARLVPH